MEAPVHRRRDVKYDQPKIDVAKRLALLKKTICQKIRAISLD